MLYGLLTYSAVRGRINLGDYIQSIAARQFLPRVDVLLNRDRLARYEGPPVKVILNGWFAHKPETWVPSPSVIPHFVSFHVSPSAADRMLSRAGLQYLMRHGPIGCRDRYTVELLHSRGVDAYFTGCLTLALQPPPGLPKGRSEMLAVDPLVNLPSLRKCLQSPRDIARSILRGDLLHLGRRDRLMRSALDHTLRSRLVCMTHEYRVTDSAHDAAIKLAGDCLQRYARARLVITSRLHCALPCLALGTPVLFLDAYARMADTCRFGGLRELLPRVEFDSLDAASTSFGRTCPLDADAVTAHPVTHQTLADALRVSCERFIAA